jgi:hypothetical protein
MTSDLHSKHADLLELAQKIDLPKLIAETSLDSCGACGPRCWLICRRGGLVVRLARGRVLRLGGWRERARQVDLRRLRL